MRSLFLRIFLSFWLSMLLVGAILVAVAMTSDPRAAELARLQRNLTSYGAAAVAALEAGGEPALADFTARLEREKHIELFLFRNDISPLPDRHYPRGLRALAAFAASTGEPQARPGRHGWWVAFPLEQDYVVAAEIPPRTPLQRFLDPHRMGLRLGIAFLVGGLVCFFLARSLTAPIRRLRRATRQFAAGRLSTRVGGEVRGKNEIAALALDFDRMAERIEDLVGSQQRLLRDISHELRSPLARLGVALELARQEANEPVRRKALDRIALEAERMNGMIAQLLDLTRLESGAPAERSAVDLAELVRRVAEDARFEAQSRGRAVVLQPGPPTVIRANPELLQRAVENVVRNGVHYTAPGTAVEVGLSRRTADGAVVVRVRDHGPGVPEEELAKIFRPFYRVAFARDRQSGGTGIGLAIAERAVRLHGGTLTAVNAEGGGLAVEIALPVAEGNLAGGETNG